MEAHTENIRRFYTRGGSFVSLGTLRSDDGDGSENFKKAIELITKTRILYVHHAFCTYHCRHCTTTTWKFCYFTIRRLKYTSDDEISSLFVNLDMVLRNSILGGFTYFDKVSDLEKSRWRLKEREFNFSATFSLPSPSCDLKVPVTSDNPQWRIQARAPSDF